MTIAVEITLLFAVVIFAIWLLFAEYMNNDDDNLNFWA
jgi:hypothetical protein